MISVNLKNDFLDGLRNIPCFIKQNRLWSKRIFLNPQIKSNKWLIKTTSLLSKQLWCNWWTSTQGTCEQEHVFKENALRIQSLREGANGLRGKFHCIPWFRWQHMVLPTICDLALLPIECLLVCSFFGVDFSFFVLLLLLTNRANKRKEQNVLCVFVRSVCFVYICTKKCFKLCIHKKMFPLWCLPFGEGADIESAKLSGCLHWNFSSRNCNWVSYGVWWKTLPKERREHWDIWSWVFCAITSSLGLATNFLASVLPWNWWGIIIIGLFSIQLAKK